MSARRGWVLALPGVAALLCGFTPPPQWLPVTARWCLAPDRCIALEVADTAQKQAWGLQMRPRLPAMRGMWFPYNLPSPLRFWMHRTPEPLDIIFLRQGRVIAIAAAIPCMRLPCPLMPAFTDDFAVFDNHTPHMRIRVSSIKAALS
jgi:uncharacterized membrane protein (UPF0127 family)